MKINNGIFAFLWEKEVQMSSTYNFFKNLKIYLKVEHKPLYCLALYTTQ